VQDNIGAMNSIRKQVRETAKRIKKLGERSQEISQIVGLLDDLSDRTSLLALNAGLQAATAGESGDNFARVADEVERLAERSNRLTQQIAGLAQTIQSETKDVVASMEETIHQVVVGSTLADKAGGALVEIEQVSQRLAALLQSISESAKQQAKSSEAFRARWKTSLK
jgi:twitching motility protein PilJ